ncbi:MAG TPA: hypothetical protein VN238_16335 [Solirubrobacteraceae bacterium]|nr:hypothetical protein [Solirubrobacteraceae bacterium]
MDDDEIRQILRRLSRPDRSGGVVVERAALMAEAADPHEVMAWIEAHGGAGESAAPAKASRGLHSARLSDNAGGSAAQPQRFVLPTDALTDD